MDRLSMGMSGTICFSSRMKRSPFTRPSRLRVRSASWNILRLSQLHSQSLHSLIRPVAYMAPTIAPMELPVMDVIS